jgi:hypothetical protein
MKGYLVKNFDKIKCEKPHQLSQNWIDVLAAVFGDVDWDNGIERYDTPYAYGYRGQNVFKEQGIAVVGNPISGDAYYAYNGLIKWHKLKK